MVLNVPWSPLEGDDIYLSSGFFAPSRIFCIDLSNSEVPTGLMKRISLDFIGVSLLYFVCKKTRNLVAQSLMQFMLERLSLDSKEQSML